MSSRLVTARKRSLGQGKVFTPICHSVHFLGRPPRQTPSLGRHTLVQTPPDRYALGRHSPLGRHPLGRHPQADTPQADTLPLADTPRQTPPLGKQCPLGRHPPGQTPPGQTPPDSQTGSTHPNGMHSCLKLIWWQKEFLRCKQVPVPLTQRFDSNFVLVLKK